MTGRPPPVADPNIVTAGLTYRKVNSKKKKEPMPVVPLLIAVAVVAVIVLLSMHLIPW